MSSSETEVAADALPAEEQEFVGQLKAALHASPDGLQPARRFLDASVPLRRYLIGRNSEAEALQNLIGIDGVIDDFSVDTVDARGVPIVRSSALPADAWVVNCSTSISPVAVNQRLQQLDIQQCLGINQIILASDGALAWPWFVVDQRRSLQQRADEWAQLYARLADAESRATLRDVVRYRLTANAGYMNQYRVRLQEQYFEDFMSYAGEVFVDAGGFDGDTTEAFCRRYPDYRRVYLFEPSATNMQAAKTRLTSWRDIQFMQMALSDRDEWLNFDSAAGSASAVDAAAVEQVRACPLDAVVASDVSLVKMDLEGWELKALRGAERLIRANRSKLALAVYHSASDFLDIPRLVLEMNPEYQVYLRHYTQGWSETVMYFK